MLLAEACAPIRLCDNSALGAMLSLQRVLCLLLLLLRTVFANETYAVSEDASWAVRSKQLSKRLGKKQALYDRFIESCQRHAGEHRDCAAEDEFRLYRNTYQVSG
jgi:hypothetical protein